MKILPPVVPYRGCRGVDPWGAGGFGAPRGQKKHTGLDFVAVVGDSVVSPIFGELIYKGFPYPGTDGVLGTVHIRGRNDCAHYLIRLFYLNCPLAPGTQFYQGDLIGTAQDISGYWRIKEPDHPGTMTNHVHLELRVNGLHGETTIVNPAHYFDTPEVV